MLRYSIQIAGRDDPIGMVAYRNMAIDAAKTASKIEKGLLIEIVYTPMGRHAEVIATYRSGKRIQ